LPQLGCRHPIASPANNASYDVRPVAKQSKAKQSKAKQSKAKQSKAKQFFPISAACSRQLNPAIIITSFFTASRNQNNALFTNL
jgi:hypothetical protein